jgi:hypothetical protein
MTIRNRTVYIHDTGTGEEDLDVVKRLDDIMAFVDGEEQSTTTIVGSDMAGIKFLGRMKSFPTADSGCLTLVRVFHICLGKIYIIMYRTNTFPPSLTPTSHLAFDSKEPSQMTRQHPKVSKQSACSPQNSS